ncbi:MAG: M48 family metallopeptidase [Candidatus Micrarchaeia archaeon]
MELPDIHANGKLYSVVVESSINKNAYARIRGNNVLITIPHRIKKAEAKKIALYLYKRMERYLNKRVEERSITIEGSGLIKTLDMEFYTKIEEKKMKNKSKVYINGRNILISVNESMSQSEKNYEARKLFAKAILKFEMPYIEKRVNDINSRYFKSNLGIIRIKTARTLWGSCSRKNNITLNFKLLLMPSKYIEYVIVHELAHTKYRNHSKVFWKNVENIIPDYKTIRRELKREGNFEISLKPAQQKIQSQLPIVF